MDDTVKAEEAGRLNGWYSPKQDAIAGVLPLPAETATIPRSEPRRHLLEAGGVESPSEKARNKENYVRIRLMIFDRHL